MSKPNPRTVPACRGCFAGQDGKCAALVDCLAAKKKYEGRCPFYKETLDYLAELEHIHGTIDVYKQIHGSRAWENLKDSGVLETYVAKAPRGRNFG